METRPWFIVSTGVSLPGVWAVPDERTVPTPAQVKKSPPKTIKPAVTWTGSQGKIETACYLRITAREEWEKIWGCNQGEKAERHCCHLDRITVPEIDFDNFMLVGVFGATNAEYGFTVVSVTEDADEIKVRYSRCSCQT